MRCFVLMRALQDFESYLFCGVKLFRKENCRISKIAEDWRSFLMPIWKRFINRYKQATYKTVFFGMYNHLRVLLKTLYKQFSKAFLKYWFSTTYGIVKKQLPCQSRRKDFLFYCWHSLANMNWKHVFKKEWQKKWLTSRRNCDWYFLKSYLLGIVNAYFRYLWI